MVRRAGYEPAFPTTGASVLLLDDRRSKRHRQLRRSGLAVPFRWLLVERNRFRAFVAELRHHDSELFFENCGLNRSPRLPARRELSEQRHLLPAYTQEFTLPLCIEKALIDPECDQGRWTPEPGRTDSTFLGQPFLWTTTCGNRERPPKGLLMAPVKRSIEKTKRRIERATEHINRCGDPPLAQGTGLAVFS